MENARVRSIRPRARRGFVEAVILIILAFLLGVGLLYYQNTIQSAQVILQRADMIRARNLARAGLERALLYIHDRYSDGESGLKYTESMGAKGLAGDLPAGSFRVVLIEPVEKIQVDEATLLKRKFVDAPYRLGRAVIGRYDLLRVRAVGATVTARVALETTVKVIREEVRY